MHVKLFIFVNYKKNSSYRSRVLKKLVYKLSENFVISKVGMMLREVVLSILNSTFIKQWYTSKKSPTYSLHRSPAFVQLKMLFPFCGCCISISAKKIMRIQRRTSVHSYRYICTWVLHRRVACAYDFTSVLTYIRTTVKNNHSDSKNLRIYIRYKYRKYIQWMREIE